jgi:hypothetical protein
MGSSSANKLNQFDLSVVFPLGIGFGFEFVDDGSIGWLILFVDANNSLRSDDGRKVLLDGVDVGNGCCWFDVLPNAAVQSASKLLASFIPRRSGLRLLFVSGDNGERRSEKSLSCSTDNSTRLSPLFDALGIVLLLVVVMVAWSIVVNFSNSRSWSSSWESVISINALIGSVGSS